MISLKHVFFPITPRERRPDKGKYIENTDFVFKKKTFLMACFNLQLRIFHIIPLLGTLRPAYLKSSLNFKSCHLKIQQKISCHALLNRTRLFEWVNSEQSCKI